MRHLFPVLFIVFLQSVHAKQVFPPSAAGMPVLFLENKGQMTDTKHRPVPAVLFNASSKNVSVFITQQGLTYVFSKQHNAEADTTRSFPPASPAKRTYAMEWLNVHLEGAQIRSENILKEGKSAMDRRYFLGHCPDGITGVGEYEKITVKDAWPGIDWVLYGTSETGLKYDFVVHPGADPGQIRLLYEGDQPIRLDDNGNIRVDMRLGELTENAPVSFSDDLKSIASAFHSEHIDAQHVRITYVLGDYPKDRQLTIDPQLVWATAYGGSEYETFSSNSHDSAGNIFVSGRVQSIDFPVLDAGTFFDASFGGEIDCCILKFDANGVLLWSTYYGGSDTDYAFSIVCDLYDNVFVVGETSSPSFPMQNSGGYFQWFVNNPFGAVDAFVLKFDNNGNRLWATCYGGYSADRAISATCDYMGNLFVAGEAGSLDFPVQNGGPGTWFQNGTIGNIFILKFDNSGNRLWATCYGGTETGSSVMSITCDSNGNPFITGSTRLGMFATVSDFPLLNNGAYFQDASNSTFYNGEAFIVKFSNTGVRLWASCYGGAGNDLGITILADPNDNIYVMGWTNSEDFPLLDAGTYFDTVCGNFNDLFLLKFDANGNRLWATYYGGNNGEWVGYGDHLAVDDCGNMYACFQTQSPDIDTKDPGNGSYLKDSLASSQARFVVRFTETGELIWATYLDDITLNGDQYCALEIGKDNALYLSDMLGPAADANMLVNPGHGAYFDTSFFYDGLMLKFIPYTSATTVAGCNCSGSISIYTENVQSTYTYVWSTGDSTTSVFPGDTLSGLCAGDYWVGFTSCYATDTVHFTIDEGETPVYEVATTAGCNDCSGSATIGFNGSQPPYTFAWSTGASTTVVAPQDTLTDLCPGDYFVAISSCYSLDTVYFTIEPGPTAAFTAGDTLSCGPFCPDFAAEAFPGAVYSWDFGDGTTASEEDPIHCYAEVGTYDVTLTLTANGCQDTLTRADYIRVHTVPEAAFSASAVMVPLYGSTVEFFEQSTGETAWGWNFGDTIPGQSDAPNPAYTYSSVGNYLVSLIATNFFCSDTATLAITVFDDFVFYVPNTFTPNGNGINETWFPKGSGSDFSMFEIAVFNRWGEVVWETKQWGDGWDGSDSPEGVYTWKATVTHPSGSQSRYNGHVSLIR